MQLKQETLNEPSNDVGWDVSDINNEPNKNKKQKTKIKNKN